MITGLTIKNVALIDSAKLTFTKGLNVLSGETGAGKSVILDSVNFVLGAKADKSMIRYGETECSVKAEFEVEEDSPSYRLLDELDIEPDTNIVISRRYTADGRGSIKVNGNAVSASMLKRLTATLVDVHGQSEHFYLLKESNQLKVLDGLAGRELEDKKKELSLLLADYKKVKADLASIGTDSSERARRIDILTFQIDEISAAALKEGEEENLREKKEQIDNAEKIAGNVQDAYACLSADGGGLDALNGARRSLGAVARYGKEYAALAERVESLLSEAEDIGETLSDLLESVSFDEREAAEVEERLDLIRTLKKKYGKDVSSINAYLAAITEERDRLLNCDEEFEKLEKQRARLLREMYAVSCDMTAIRKRTADQFSSRIVAELKTLNIPKASFTVEFAPYTEEDVASVGENGLDSICFLFSANAGEPLKPLGKIISGGEMSRFMLAMKTQLSGVNGISTYIFDEIDTGISGKTAKVVAEKIAKISKDTQVIAVSHLAQIAAMSDNHLYIEKSETDGKTLTRVNTLDKAGKIREIVRLLGGETDGGYAEKHALELYENGERYKNSL